MALYHVTPSERVERIRSEGLKGRSYADSPRRIDQAEHALNTMLDRRGVASVNQYRRREGSIFFWASEETARERSNAHNTILHIDVKEEWLPLTCAEDAAIERLFGTVREGYLNGDTTRAGGLRPAYDAADVEERVNDVLHKKTRQWHGQQSSAIQVWGLATVDPTRISVLDSV